MAKSGLTLQELHRIIKEDEQWALCIGAGTSKGLIPDWMELIEKLIAELNLPSISTDNFLKKGYSLDAIIQAIKEMSGGIDDKTFIEKLSQIIYSPIQNQLSNNKEWESFKTVHDWNIGYASRNTNHHKESWERFGLIKKQIFGNTTAYSMAEALAEGFMKGIKPSSILTFNGEACFLALLNSFLFDKTNKIPNFFDRVINSISDRRSSGIPCYHCHGTIPIKGVKYKSGYKADEKLVFSEDSYLQLANNNFSWQSSSFINTCLHNKVIFVGVSLTDSNMRRWLSWIHHTKLREMELNEIKTSDTSTEHYWINKIPDDKTTKVWYENLVSLLGVRIIWIDKWEEAATAIKIILGISSPQKKLVKKSKAKKRTAPSKYKLQKSSKRSYKKVRKVRDENSYQNTTSTSR